MVNEEKETQNQTQFESEYEKRLRQIYESGEATPTVALAYITHKIIKGEIEAVTLGGEQHVAQKVVAWDIREGVPEEPTITAPERSTTSGIIGGIDVSAYSEMIRRILREHRGLIHPRTREFIPGCTNDVNPPSPNKKHLAGFPRVAYHRKLNRRQVGGRFVITQKPTERVSPADTSQLQYRLEGELKFQDTSQWKSVWYMKGQRRK